MKRGKTRLRQRLLGDSSGADLCDPGACVPHVSLDSPRWLIRCCVPYAGNGVASGDVARVTDEIPASSFAGR